MCGRNMFSEIGTRRFGTVLADPPWKFSNSTGKMAPEHRRLYRYNTMTNDEILTLPVGDLALPESHLYLWVPNALLDLGLQVMESWGFEYKTNIIWYKVRKDGGPDRRGVGFYFRNVTEIVLFGVKGKLRTLQPGRRQPNIIVAPKREHSRKPDELYSIIEACSPGPYLELFARHRRASWTQWGNEAPSEPEEEPEQIAMALPAAHAPEVSTPIEDKTAYVLVGDPDLYATTPQSVVPRRLLKDS